MKRELRPGAGVPISRKNAEHYRWGGVSGTECDAWYLVRDEGLHVIEERMPPGTAETRHSHERARQFFYVLEGTLSMRVSGDLQVAKGGEGIEIPPGVVHQAINDGSEEVRFLVISAPPSHGDRVEA